MSDTTTSSKRDPISAPALFIMEPIGVDGALEANGQVYYFCSERCRRVFEVEYEPRQEIHAGYSPDWIEGTVCDECGSEIRH